MRVCSSHNNFAVWDKVLHALSHVYSGTPDCCWKGVLSQWCTVRHLFSSKCAQQMLNSVSCCWKLKYAIQHIEWLLNRMESGSIVFSKLLLVEWRQVWCHVAWWKDPTRWLKYSNGTLKNNSYRNWPITLTTTLFHQPAMSVFMLKS